MRTSEFANKIKKLKGRWCPYQTGGFIIPITVIKLPPNWPNIIKTGRHLSLDQFPPSKIRMNERVPIHMRVA